MSRSEATASAGATNGWRWSVLAVVVTAVFLRFLYLGSWSLWEDEEGTIYYALNPDKAFPSFFPLFFVGLRAVFDLVGESSLVARVFSAVVGLLSLWIVFVCVRRFLSRGTALLAVFFLAINLGHVFWSQSVRYYTAVLSFEVLSLYWFFRGFEEERPTLLLLANGALVLALLTHFSAVLLVPVFIGYLGLALLSTKLVPRYGTSLYLTFGSALIVVLTLFARRIAELQGMLGGGAGLPSARDPFHVFLTFVAYVGPALMALGAVGVYVNRTRRSRFAVLMTVTALIPMLELIVIALLHVINVTWYYGFVAVVGFAVLAADGVVELFHRGARRWATGLVAGTVAYSLVFLAIYFTTGYGDRPRWRDAAEYMRQTEGFRTSGPGTPQIFATAPNVFAFYLGVRPDATQGQTLVDIPANVPVPATLTRDRWYVIPAFELDDPLKASLESQCRREATFAARTGPRDRSLQVYHCRMAAAAELN